MAYTDPATRRRRLETLRDADSAPEAHALAQARWTDLTAAPATGPGPSVRAVLDRYNTRPDIAPRTRYLELKQGARILAVLDGDAPAAALTTAAVEDLRAARTKAGCGPRGVNAELGLLRAALNAAVRADLLAAPPCRFPRPLPDRPKRRRDLTLPEVEALLAAMPARDHDAATVLAWTGLRPVELWALTVADWDAARGIIRVDSAKRGRGSAKAARAVPAVPVVAAILNRRAKAARGGLLFGVAPEKRKPRTNPKGWPRGSEAGDVHRAPSGFAARVTAAAARAGIDRPEEVTPYVLRHSFATNFPGDVADLQAVLGHSTPLLTLALYKHARTDRLAASMAAMTMPAAPLNPQPPRQIRDKPPKPGGGKSKPRKAAPKKTDIAS